VLDAALEAVRAEQPVDGPLRDVLHTADMVAWRGAVYGLHMWTTGDLTDQYVCTEEEAADWLTKNAKRLAEVAALAGWDYIMSSFGSSHQEWEEDEDGTE
jgi:hypothetical protein